MSPVPRDRLASAGRRVREAPRPNLVERRMTKFLRQPPSVRTAASVIVTATALVVVAGGVAMRLLDQGRVLEHLGGLWWAIQTVTTESSLSARGSRRLASRCATPPDRA